MHNHIGFLKVYNLKGNYHAKDLHNITDGNDFVVLETNVFMGGVKTSVPSLLQFGTKVQRIWI